MKCEFTYLHHFGRGTFTTFLLVVMSCMLFACCACVPRIAFASYATPADEYPAMQDLGSYGDPLYASDIPAGTYSVTARTTSRMCIMYENNGDADANVNKERCLIQVNNGQIVAAFYISKAYTRLYMGTAEEAASLTNADGTDDSAYLAGEPIDSYAPHRFVIAIPALNVPMTISTFSGGQFTPGTEDWVTGPKWYTRQVVFSPGPDLLKAIEDAKNPPLADKSVLAAGLAEAKNDYASTPTSADGSDIDQGAYWVPQSAKDAFASALAAAQQVVDDGTATQDQVDAAVGTLQSAWNAFAQAKGVGTKASEGENSQGSPDKKPATAEDILGDLDDLVEDDGKKDDSGKDDGKDNREPVDDSGTSADPVIPPPSGPTTPSGPTINPPTAFTGDTPIDNGEDGGSQGSGANANANANAGAAASQSDQAANDASQAAQQAESAQTTAAPSVRHGVLLSPVSLADKLGEGDGLEQGPHDEEQAAAAVPLEVWLGLGVAGLVVAGIAARVIVFNRARRMTTA